MEFKSRLLKHEIDSLKFSLYLQLLLGKYDVSSMEFHVSRRSFQDAEATEEEKKSNHVQKKLAKRVEGHKLDSHLEDQFASGRLLACIASRPGQCGRADGYILEGKELEFYQKKIQKKKGKGAAA